MRWQRQALAAALSGVLAAGTLLLPPKHAGAAVPDSGGATYSTFTDNWGGGSGSAPAFSATAIAPRR